MSTKSSQRHTQTQVDTISFTHDEAAAWPLPEFQREKRVNAKVKLLAEQIANDGGVIPGIMTFGQLETRRYLIDGQHRREAFLISGKPVGYSDVRICRFETYAQMGQEYVNLNSRLVSMRPDDMLRGLESSSPPLQLIRKECPFAGYGNIRRGGPSAPIVSMSAALRSWSMSSRDCPNSVGMSAADLVAALTNEDAASMSAFLNIAEEAWGRDPEYYRLWGNLNLILTMWLYRRLVVMGQYSGKVKRMTLTQFKACMTSLSADSRYLDWLVGRMLSERDRAPCYHRIKAVFQKRILVDTGKKVQLPAPEWAPTSSSINKIMA